MASTWANAQADTQQATRQRKRTPAHETDKALHAYLVYERLGRTRTFAAAATELREEDGSQYGATQQATLMRRLQAWAHDHLWSDRVRAYDLAQEEKEREALEQARREMNEYQAQLSRALARGIYTRIADLMNLDQGIVNAAKQQQILIAQQQPIPGELRDMLGTRVSLNVGSRTLSELWRSVVDVERLARGEATEIAQQQHQGGVLFQVVAADPSGAALTSPFDADPDALLAVDAERLRARTAARLPAALADDSDDDSRDDSRDDLVDDDLAGGAAPETPETPGG